MERHSKSAYGPAFAGMLNCSWWSPHWFRPRAGQIAGFEVDAVSVLRLLGFSLRTVVGTPRPMIVVDPRPLYRAQNSLNSYLSRFFAISLGPGHAGNLIGANTSLPFSSVLSMVKVALPMRPSSTHCTSS